MCSITNQLEIPLIDKSSLLKIKCIKTKFHVQIVKQFDMHEKKIINMSFFRLILSYVTLAMLNFNPKKTVLFTIIFSRCVITMTTVGYGDVYPRTTAGKILAGMCSISGIILLAFPISVIVDNFNQVFKRLNLKNMDYFHSFFNRLIIRKTMSTKCRHSTIRKFRCWFQLGALEHQKSIILTVIFTLKCLW